MSPFQLCIGLWLLSQTIDFVNGLLAVAMKAQPSDVLARASGLLMFFFYCTAPVALYQLWVSEWQF